MSSLFPNSSSSASNSPMSMTGGSSMSSPANTTTASPAAGFGAELGATSAAGMNGLPPLKVKRGMSGGLMMGVVILVLVVVGALAGFYLLQMQQDVRQQAQGEPYDQACVDTCLKTASGDLTECRAMCPVGGSAPTCKIPGAKYNSATKMCDVAVWVPPLL